MAACLVPDFPAVKIALEHLAELDKQLRDEGVSFSQEASLHLREIADAIKELEASRKAAHEELEVETIETSKLRHQVLSQRDDIMNEILAAVATARDASAAEMTQLQSEMKRIVEEIESMEKRRKLLEEEYVILLPQRETMKGSHSDVVEQLNEQLLEKAKEQIALTELNNNIKVTKEKITQVEAAKKHLKENMIQEKKRFAETKEMLLKEIEETMNIIEEQKKTNANKRSLLDAVLAELQEKEENVTDSSERLSRLEKSIDRLNASQQKCKEQLQQNIEKSKELQTQRELHEEKLQEERDAFQQKLQSLQETTAEVEHQLQEGQKVNRVHQESIGELSARLRAQKKMEDGALADHHSLSRQLEESKQSLEERMASIAKYKLEVRQMEEEMKQLQETNIVNAKLFQKNMEELEGELTKENNNRAALEVQRDELSQSLESLKEQHEQHVRELTADIELMTKKHSDLQEEKMKLQEHEAMSSLIDQLTNMIASAEEQRRQMEVSYRAEIQQITMDAESITRARLEQEESLRVQESVLKEAEAQFEADQSRHQTIKEQTTEMKTRKKQLELSIQEVKGQTAELFKPREELKTELQSLRAERMEKLVNQAAEIRATEKSIYENGLMLERVSMENSRLHLRIEQMKEDISVTKKDKERLSQQTDRMKEEAESLCGSLLEAWVTDKLATEESTERDQKLLEAFYSFTEKIQQRKHRIGDLNSSLEKELTAMSCLLEIREQKEA